MDFASFDGRGYPVVSVEVGYAEWANHYDATVTVGLKDVNWPFSFALVWSKLESVTAPKLLSI